MAAAAARAPTALRAAAYAGIDLSTFSVLKVVARSQGRGYGGGQTDVGLLPPGPMRMVGTFKSLLETRMRALGDLKIGGRSKIV
jgi:hypothetical protein